MIHRFRRLQHTAHEIGDPVVVLRGAWLSDDVVLFTCSPATGAFSRPTGTSRIEGRRLALPRSPMHGADAPITVCAAHGLGRMPAGPRDRVITVDAVDHLIAIRERELLDSITDLRTLLLEQFVSLEVDSRSQLTDFLATLSLAFGQSRALTAGLRIAREALRERHPLSIRADDPDLAIGLDAVCRIDGRRFYAHGWVADGSVPMLELTALSPEGELVELTERAIRHPRPDLAHRLSDSGVDARRAGFACLFETRSPSSGAGWVFTVRDARDACVETPETALIEDCDEARRVIAAVAEWDFEERSALLDQHAEPAMTGLQAGLRDRIGLATLEAFGATPEDPEISIVLSMDAECELLEHHLSQVADDPTLRACQLICVQDGPGDVERSSWRAAQLFDLYGSPFSLAVLTERGGTAMARAAGASVAAGRRVLFIDAGVLALVPGWLSPLARFHAATPKAGAIGGKLVGPDRAISHAGYAVEGRPGGAALGTVERFAGLHESLPAANVTCAVPAVSGACMLVDKALYAAAAVESWRYLNGGYADSDACLRMADAGYESWYLPRVGLMLLKVDGRPPADRRTEGAYNRWLLGRLNPDRLEAAGKQRYAVGFGAPA